MKSVSNDLNYNVSGLLHEQVGATRGYELNEPELDLDENQHATDLTGSVQLLRIGTGILATVTVKATVELQCSRCLIPIKREVETKFEEDFRPTVSVATGEKVAAALEGEDEEDFFRISPQQVLDITEAIRQNLLVNVPLQALCKPDCAGLCPVCGADRNVENCGHTIEHHDARFAALSDLLDRLEE